MRKWTGDPPTACQLCKSPVKDVFIDGRTILGPWACMCERCHASHGCGLGTNRGQMFELVGDAWVDSRDALEARNRQEFGDSTVDKILAGGLSEAEIERLLALKSSSDYNHVPRDPIGVEGEDDTPFL